MPARSALLAAALCLAGSASAHAAQVQKDGPCTKAQLDAINKAQEAAKSRLLSAKMILTQSPNVSSSRSQGGAQKGNAVRGASARELSIKLLGADPRQMNVESVLANMFTVLTNKSMPVRCAKPNESLCKETKRNGKASGMGAAAYVTKYPRVMSFCPKFFTRSSVVGVSLSESQIQTVVHESGHMAGVGFSTAEEEYCWDGFTCDRACGQGTPSASADNWAQFVQCVSGAPVLKPSTVVANTKPAQKPAPKPAQKKK